MNKVIKNTVLAIALAASTISMNAPTFAQQKDPTAGRVQQKDPTAGRIEARERARELARRAQALKKYNQCAARAMRYFRACSSNAAGNSNMTRSCRTVYHGKLDNCRGLYL